jgi:hypothetical protein
VTPARAPPSPVSLRVSRATFNEIALLLVSSGHHGRVSPRPGAPARPENADGGERLTRIVLPATLILRCP